MLTGYMLAPSMLPIIMPPSGAAPFPVQVNSLPRPPIMTAGPVAVPGAPMANSSSSTPPMHQVNSTPTTSGGFDSST
ncbi:U1 small nuclear ribonucleoprotein C-like [Diospyros lotus]|uniref:U1 small nuclear ribonucleoprotein C-like n=1 Tax=Diospyros lotus TaxID=55363 RepID=UPI002256EE52|nr:U1 small nuclear ribonucleoprotein C-like [Diospyros lotus]